MLKKKCHKGLNIWKFDKNKYLNTIIVFNFVKFYKNKTLVY